MGCDLVQLANYTHFKHLGVHALFPIIYVSETEFIHIQMTYRPKILENVV